jgi:hypothetical protein
MCGHSVRAAPLVNAATLADITASAGAPPRAAYARRCHANGALDARRSALDSRIRVGGACTTRAAATDTTAPRVCGSPRQRCAASACGHVKRVGRVCLIVCARAMFSCDVAGCGARVRLRGLARALRGAHGHGPPPPDRPHLPRGEFDKAVVCGTISRGLRAQICAGSYIGRHASQSRRSKTRRPRIVPAGTIARVCGLSLRG